MLPLILKSLLIVPRKSIQMVIEDIPLSPQIDYEPYKALFKS